MQNIKEYREKELKYYVLVNCFIIVFFGWNISNEFSLINAMKSTLENGLEDGISALLSELIGAGVFSSIASVYAFIFDSLISSDLKYKMCYFVFGKQPRYTIFSDVRNGKSDSRFTKEQALLKYRDIYDRIDNPDQEDAEGDLENSLWYGIYSKHKDSSMIFNANRDYLLCRDLCVMTVTIIVFYILSCMFGMTDFYCKLFGFLMLEACVTNVAFRIKGKRLAFDVLALDISSR